MRRLLATIAFLTMLLAASAQDAATAVGISVAMPQNCMLENNTMTMLKSKLLGLATADGMSATDCGAIAMVPEVTVSDEQIIESGMRNTTSVRLHISISVLNIFNGTVFSTIQADCKGEGYSGSEARRNAIRNMDLKTCEAEFRNVKSKIVAYYNANTPAIITKANTLAAQQEYEEALAVLSSYPESLPGYPQVSAAMVSIFKLAQTRHCSQLLQEARSAFANRDYATAASLLAMIDATSSCAQEAKTLQNAIKRDADIMYANEIKAESEQRKANERVAQATIKAARDVAVAYFKRQTRYVFFW